MCSQNSIAKNEQFELDNHYIINCELFCCGRKCNYYGKLYSQYLFTELNLNCLLCKECWLNDYKTKKNQEIEIPVVHVNNNNLDEIRFLSISEAREKYPLVPKDCFVFPSIGKRVQARCLWCREYTSNLKIYTTYFDSENIRVYVAGHEHNCS